jgi:hypothetical protein
MLSILERDLGRLIMKLNPKGPMRFSHVDAPTAQINEKLKAAIAELDANAPDLSQFHLELEDNLNYQTRWSWIFRGQERFLMRAIRIGYRYPILEKDSPLATDYVLVGFEGGGGP